MRSDILLFCLHEITLANKPPATYNVPLLKDG
jgi:hypothetical protein